MEDMYIKTKTKHIPIRGYNIAYSGPGIIVAVSCDNPEDVSGGFLIYSDKTLIFDGTKCIYRWDVLDHKPNIIYYTNDPKCKQEKPFPTIPTEVEEQVDSLTNEELTNCVADLMYQIDKMKLGLEE